MAGMWNGREIIPEPETIKVRVRVCECGARYATPGVATMHKCKLNDGGPGSFRTVTETRPKPETRISYQPGARS